MIDAFHFRLTKTSTEELYSKIEKARKLGRRIQNFLACEISKILSKYFLQCHFDKITYREKYSSYNAVRN